MILLLGKDPKETRNVHVACWTESAYNAALQSYFTRAGVDMKNKTLGFRVYRRAS